LYAYLKDTPQIADLVGERIYHEWMPQPNNEWPVLVFFKVSTTEQAEEMCPEESPRVDVSNYQFDIYGRKSKQVTEAADTFDSVFRNFVGTMGATRIQQIALGNISHLGEIVGDKMVRRVSLDYAITHDV
jgi:hypothetical protein